MNKKIIRARAYFSGLGIGELYLNGERVGDALLEPAQTDYEKRVLYAAYDVTEQLRGGENAVGVMLGDGWYHQNRVWADGSFSYGDCRMLLETISGTRTAPWTRCCRTRAFCAHTAR